MALAINIHELLNGKVIEWERLEFKQGLESGRRHPYALRLCQ